MKISKKKEEKWWHVYQDTVILLMSVAFAVLLSQSGWVHSFLQSFGNAGYIGSFLAGIFFTSALTTAPAIAVLMDLSREVSVLYVALLGGLGAVLGDYLIFFFLKDRIADDMDFLLSLSPMRRLPHIFRTRFLRSLMPFIGALVIASPLPDELGIALMGLSRTSDRLFLPLSFSFNVLGILLIGLLAGGHL